MDTFLSFAIPVCTILLGLSAFFDKWAELSQRPLYQRPRINTAFLGKTGFKFFWFFLFTILSISLTFYTTRRSDKKAKRELAQRDLTHEKHDDSLQFEYKKGHKSNKR